MKFLECFLVVLTVLLAFTGGTVRAATNFVTSAADDGSAGTLRTVITNSISGDTITFTSTLSGATILLTNASGELLLNNNLTIDGSALANGVSIDGNHAHRVFKITSGATVLLDSLTITNGYIANDFGGGIENYGGTLIINHCTVTGNSAYTGGGIESDGTTTVNQSTISANFGAISAGGIDIGDLEPVALNNSTVTGNSCAGNDGYNVGGIANRDATLTVDSCTIVSNFAPAVGFAGPGLGNAGGILNEAGFILFVTNSIVAGNDSGSGADIYNQSVIFCGGANIIQVVSNDNISGLGTVTGPAAITNTPLLAPLGNYGGPTKTMPPLPGSPAIDACTNGAPSFATDQRGYPRIVGLFADIGAVEGIYNPAGPGVLTVLTRPGNGTFVFGLTNLTDTSLTVLAATNLTTQTSNWTPIGLATENPVGSGNFQFTDPQASNSPQRFYRVRTP
jgi:hypothetical protein